MLGYLWTKVGSPPPEYIELVLCRDVYHCTPSELAEQDYKTVQDHLTILEAEAEVNRMRRKK